jgi:ABC-type phosphate transport system permease subunit
MSRAARQSRLGERLINGGITFSGLTAVLFVVLIFFFWFREALPLFAEYPVAKLLDRE